MNVMKMYLENTDETDKSMMSIAGKMNLLLKTMENKGSFFISCINTNIPVKEAEEWYEQGLIGEPEYRKFYETVNLIEESFGFEIYKKSEYPTLYTHSINQIASTYQSTQEGIKIGIELSLTEDFVNARQARSNELEGKKLNIII